MNSDFSKMTPEERDVQITALALGELGPEEASQVRAAIAADPALQRAFELRQKSIGLVQEMVHTDHGVSAEAPARLSAERREKLLKIFAAGTAKAMPRRKRDPRSLWYVPMSIAAILIGLLGLSVVMLSRWGTFSKASAQRIALLNLPKGGDNRAHAMKGINEADEGEKRPGLAFMRSGRRSGLATPSRPATPLPLAPAQEARDFSEPKFQISGQVQAPSHMVSQDTAPAKADNWVALFDNTAGKTLSDLGRRSEITVSRHGGNAVAAPAETALTPGIPLEPKPRVSSGSSSLGDAAGSHYAIAPATPAPPPPAAIPAPAPAAIEAGKALTGGETFFAQNDWVNSGKLGPAPSQAGQKGAGAAKGYFYDFNQKPEYFVSDPDGSQKGLKEVDSLWAETPPKATAPSEQRTKTDPSAGSYGGVYSVNAVGYVNIPGNPKPIPAEEFNSLANNTTWNAPTTESPATMLGKDNKAPAPAATQAPVAVNGRELNSVVTDFDADQGRYRMIAEDTVAEGLKTPAANEVGGARKSANWGFEVGPTKPEAPAAQDPFARMDVAKGGEVTFGRPQSSRDRAGIEAQQPQKPAEMAFDDFSGVTRGENLFLKAGGGRGQGGGGGARSMDFVGVAPEPSSTPENRPAATTPDPGAAGFGLSAGGSFGNAGALGISRPTPHRGGEPGPNIPAPALATPSAPASGPATTPLGSLSSQPSQPVSGGGTIAAFTVTNGFGDAFADSRGFGGFGATYAGGALRGDNLADQARGNTDVRFTQRLGQPVTRVNGSVDAGATVSLRQPSSSERIPDVALQIDGAQPLQEFARKTDDALVVLDGERSEKDLPQLLAKERAKREADLTDSIKDGREESEERAKQPMAKRGRPGQPGSQPSNVAIESLAKVENGATNSSVPSIQPAPVADTPAPKPASAPPVPQPEILTRENAFSTFSLNVADVSFKLAGASLDRGAMPDASTIRAEEFINAFDYHDPLPALGMPVAFASERAHYPFAHNRDVLRFSVKTAAEGREGGRPLNLVILLDNSGSMERADRVQIIQASLATLAAQFHAQDKLSVVTFARTARLWFDGLSGTNATHAARQVSNLTPEGGTNLEEAMNLAYQTALRHYQPQAINRVVLLTDGAANLGNVDPAALKAKVESYRKQGIALDCFGIGWEGYNDDLLEQLSRNGDGRYGFVNAPEEAGPEFAAQLAGALHVAASDVKVQVEFNPKRVTNWRQVGYAKHQLKKEQFRDNTVDAAEIGAAEAGNGLYIVETNPNGEGPIATVRVRFKVPGTSDYREHEWPVAYSPSTPTMEQASAAMRLSVSSAAFAEWLASSPYAGEVTTDKLLAMMRGVPDQFGADTRAKRLESMIQQAKALTGK